MNREQLLQYLKDKLRVDTSKIDDQTALFSSGMIDSFSMVDLVVFLESTANFKISPMDVNLENLDTVERILSFVQRAAG